MCDANPPAVLKIAKLRRRTGIEQQILIALSVLL
jgi:hypothetical protein